MKENKKNKKKENITVEKGNAGVAEPQGQKEWRDPKGLKDHAGHRVISATVKKTSKP